VTRLTPDEKRGFWRDLRLLFAQAFSDRSLIEPATYASYNIVLGALLLVVAALSHFQPTPRSITETVLLAGSGVVLVSALVLVRVRPDLLPRLMLIQGALVVGLAVAFVASTVIWSFRAPVHAQFRYLPGITLVLMLYGFLQLAEFGPRPRSSCLRRTGLWLGIGGELIAALCLLLRFTRA